MKKIHKIKPTILKKISILWKYDNDKFCTTTITLAFIPLIMILASSIVTDDNIGKITFTIFTILAIYGERIQIKQSIKNYNNKTEKQQKKEQ